MITRILRQLYEQPPKTILRKLAARLGIMDPKSARIAELLASSKARPQWPIDFLTRYEHILARTIGWTPMVFEGKVVLEIGCGPLLGWGPLAIFRGAEKFVAIDPVATTEILFSEPILARYLRPLFNDLAAVYGPVMDWSAFREALATRVVPIPSGIVTAKDRTNADIVISNSCLEHLFPLRESIDAIAARSGPGCRFLHLVDFGNHRTPAAPFRDLYEREPVDYWQRHGREINLAKPSDLMREFDRAGLPADCVTYYTAAMEDGGVVSPHWQKYPAAELTVKAALIAGPRSA